MNVLVRPPTTRLPLTSLPGTRCLATVWEVVAVAEAGSAPCAATTTDERRRAPARPAQRARHALRRVAADATDGGGVAVIVRYQRGAECNVSRGRRELLVVA